MVGQAAFGSREHLVVADTKSLDPALLTAGEGDEKTQLDELRLAEVQVQPAP
jgi:hypothetical protein